MKKLGLLLLLVGLVGIAKAQWVQTSFDSTSVLCFATNGSKIFAGTQQGYGVYYSNNYGSSWTNFNNNNGLPSSAYYEICSICILGSNILVATNGLGIYHSSNNGLNWNSTNSGLNDINDSGVFALTTNGTEIFAGTNNGVFSSVNNGAQWTHKGLSDTLIRSIAINGYNIFAGSYSSGMFLSSNNCGSWSAIDNGLPFSGSYPMLNTMTINGNNIYIGNNFGIYLTTDNGTTWSCLNNSLPYTQVYAIIINGSNIIIGTYQGGVFLSSDNGLNWTAINDGLGNLDVGSLMINGPYIFAGTWGSGVWMQPLSELGIMEPKNNGIKISVFPNPCNRPHNSRNPSPLHHRNFKH